MSAKADIILIGISGPSSSGKSTLARLLVALFPGSFILHEDDFYKPEADIPVKNGVVDWDCPGAIDFPQLFGALEYIKKNKKLPEDVAYKEDQNPIGIPPLSIEEAIEIKNTVLGSLTNLDSLQFCVIDGFLLYNDPSIIETLDLRILLRAPHDLLKSRRETRNGYATLEGFWVDPPEYFDKYVWPGYIESHKHLFANGDVDADLSEYAHNLNIHAIPALELPMADLLKWTLELISAAFSA
ncbi:P-loop containing nucleoside triphosphate hydrolase protein [Lipomyces oligophaga]|uniref:P-loop containing nucleoside triphosphate hydrolase protein n=1 Tax=Lipomyces oligophaga TaxID=45792 RepID=UPI0034CD80C0